MLMEVPDDFGMRLTPGLVYGSRLSVIQRSNAMPKVAYSLKQGVIAVGYISLFRL